jgi:plastocyanin
MRRPFLSFLVLTIARSAFGAGTGDIEGDVRVVAGSVASRITGPQEVIVYLEDAPNVGSMPHGPFEMTQISKDFTPSVLIVPQGATVNFPNHDPIQHNVFSVTPGNTFDLGLHKSGDTASTRLDSPGVVSVYCNIHPQMVGYILVVANPFFARVRADATFQIRGVPAGTYKAVAWFPFGQASRTEVKVEAGAKADLHFLLHERSDAGRHNRKDGSLYLQYGPGAAP